MSASFGPLVNFRVHIEMIASRLQCDALPNPGSNNLFNFFFLNLYQKKRLFPNKEMNQNSRQEKEKDQQLCHYKRLTTKLQL